MIHVVFENFVFCPFTAPFLQTKSPSGFQVALFVQTARYVLGLFGAP